MYMKNIHVVRGMVEIKLPVLIKIIEMVINIK